MDGDGTQNGYDLNLTESVANIVDIPVIASGGAGSLEDIYDVFKEGRASAALLASLLHDNKLTLSAPALKRSLIEETESIPPPTVNGIFTDFAVLETRSTNAVSYTHLTLPTIFRV